MKKTLLISIVSLFSVVMHAQLLTLSVTVTNATACTAPCNGSATVNVIGGTAPYTYIWNIPLAPQMTQTATGLCPGSYQVAVFDSGVPIPSQGQQLVTISCSTANGVIPIAEETSVSVFPNPAQNVLNVNTNSQQGYMEIVIRNILGSEAYKGTISGGTQQLDVSALPAGIYMLECISNEESVRTKFIKN